MLGYEPGELVGMDHWRVYHPEYQEITRHRAQARMRGEKVTTHYEVKLNRKDGSWFYGEIGASAIDVEGQPGIQVWVRNIHDRKLAEEALRQSETKYRNILQNAQVGIYRTRFSDGKVLECNDRFAKTFGYETSEECIADFISADHYVDPGARDQMLAQVRAYGEANDFEARMSRKDGDIVWV
jgi:PAS domain S-box-containing protein